VIRLFRAAQQRRFHDWNYLRQRIRLGPQHLCLWRSGAAVINAPIINSVWPVSRASQHRRLPLRRPPPRRPVDRSPPRQSPHASRQAGIVQSRLSKP
jgi:hypothetical protein